MSQEGFLSGDINGYFALPETNIKMFLEIFLDNWLICMPCFGPKCELFHFTCPRVVPKPYFLGLVKYKTRNSENCTVPTF